MKPILIYFKSIIIAIILFTLSYSYGQETFSSRLLDSKTEEPIAFATIQFNYKTGVISNDNGEFNITIKREVNATDSLMISCLGYEEKRIPLINFDNSNIYLKPKTVDLSEVLVTNKNYTIDEILDKIEEGLYTNYDFGYAKRKLFFRASKYIHMDKRYVDLEESTIPEISQHFVDSLIQIIPESIDNHTEILGELYGEIARGKPQKMEILKASRLFDKSTEVDLNNYAERLNGILKKHIKRDSYFKIKSGWFSVKQDIDTTLFDENQEKTVSKPLLAEQNKRDSIQKLNFLPEKKTMIHQFENNNFIDDDNDLNFIHKSRRYEFEISDYAYIDDMFVYVITFEPKRREDFAGTMYVNTEDFAVVRVDYNNVESLSDFSLLGISSKKYLKKGTIIFRKNNNEKYVLKYRDETLGEQFGIKRPLKIVEKNKNVRGRRKQNEIKAEIHFIGRTIEKTELVVFETDIITASDYTNFKEKALVTPTHLSQYDPEFWKGYNIIEPNKALKDFKVLDTEN